MSFADDLKMRLEISSNKLVITPTTHMSNRILILNWKMLVCSQ